MSLTTSIHLTVLSLHMEDSHSIDEGKINRRHAVIFSVGYSDISDSITLDTGEVFAYPRHRHFRGNEDKEPIAFSVQLFPARDEKDYSYNKLRYSEDNDSTEDYIPSFINAHCWLPPDQFYALAMNLRCGRYPTALELEIEFDPIADDSPMEFGSAPNGSELVWHTKEKTNRAIDIVGVGFHYNLIQPAEDMDWDDPQSARADPTYTAARMEKQLQEVTNHLANISKILAVGFGIAIVVAITAAWN